MMRASPRPEEETAMPKFVLMTKLTPDALHDAGGRRAMGKDWIHKVKEVCPKVKWIAHYALLGPYDFMDIYEAPDVDTAHQVSLISRAEGALSAESWPAVPYDEFLVLLEEVRK
jgi:uncharacterized protein with GYD domain